MTQPAADSFALDVYGAVEPLAREDERYDWATLIFVMALSAPFQPVEDLVRDTDQGPGWSQTLDIDRAPEAGLEWLAQWIGVRLPAGLTDTQKRDRIRAADGWKRGTVAAIVAAGKQHLTGTKRLVVQERWGSAYRIRVISYATQTPDPDQVRAALSEQKVGGLVLIYDVLTGQTWDELRDGAGGRTWDEVEAEFDTWDDARDLIPA